jgi:hypothetical protein
VAINRDYLDCNYTGKDQSDTPQHRLSGIRWPVSLALLSIKNCKDQKNCTEYGEKKQH